MIEAGWTKYLLSSVPREAEGPGGGAPPAPAGGVKETPAAPAPGAAPVEGAKPGTIAGGETPTTPQTAPPDWPADWRAKLSGDDKAALKQLERLGSPSDLFKSYRELQAKLSSGELRAPPKPLAKDATPEQAAAWRKEQGLPATPEDYKPELPQGIVLGEADKPIVADFAKFAHGKNWDQAKFNEALGWYYGFQDQANQQRAEYDNTFKQEALTALTQEWGGEFKANQNAIGNLLALAPEGLADQLLSGRLANGNLVGNDPATLKFFAHLARELNPASTVLPASSGGDMKSIDGRIGEIEGFMKAPIGSENYSKYWTSPNLQAELRTLYGAREKMKERAAA